MEPSLHPSPHYPSNKRVVGTVEDWHEPRESDVYIAVMGVTGAGKSTFISHLAETKVEVGDGLNACTQRVEMYRCKLSGPGNIWLVDTPGFDDTHRTDTEVLREIASWLKESLSANNVILNGMIYLHRITEARMRGSAMNNLFMFKKLCGPNAFKNVILATTVWEQVSPEDGQRREKQLIHTSEFWGEMILGGAQVKRHYNNADSAWGLVDVFASKGSTKQKAVLTIQDEMVNQHKALANTDAGREIESSLIRERERWSRELKETKDMMHEALKAKDKESLEQLRITEDKMDKKIKAIESEREELKAGMKSMYEEEMSKLRREVAQQSQNSAGVLKKCAQLESTLLLMKLQAQQEEGSSDEDSNLQQLPKNTQLIDRHHGTIPMGCSSIIGNVNMSLSGEYGFFSGPKYSSWQLSEKVPLNSERTSVTWGVVGKDKALYLHSHNKSRCSTTTYGGFEIEYPNLHSWIQRFQFSDCPQFAALGNDGHCLFMGSGRGFRQLSPNVDRAVPQIKELKGFALGFNDTFVAIKNDGETIFDLRGQYRELNYLLHTANSIGRHVKSVALNLENGKTWAVIWETGGANWSLSGEINHRFKKFMIENS